MHAVSMLLATAIAVAYNPVESALSHALVRTKPQHSITFHMASLCLCA